MSINLIVSRNVTSVLLDFADANGKISEWSKNGWTSSLHFSSVSVIITKKCML